MRTTTSTWSSSSLSAALFSDYRVSRASGVLYSESIRSWGKRCRMACGKRTDKYQMPSFFVLTVLAFHLPKTHLAISRTLQNVSLSSTATTLQKKFKKSNDAQSDIGVLVMIYILQDNPTIQEFVSSLAFAIKTMTRCVQLVVTTRCLKLKTLFLALWDFGLVCYIHSPAHIFLQSVDHYRGLSDVGCRLIVSSHQLSIFVALSRIMRDIDIMVWNGPKIVNNMNDMIKDLLNKSRCFIYFRSPQFHTQNTLPALDDRKVTKGFLA